MKTYRTKAGILPGTDFHEVRKKAFDYYLKIKRKSKRKPYVRSAYFSKDKIFLDLFWIHLYEKKNFMDLMRRLKFFECAIELIRNSRFEPVSKENVDKTSEILHRFAGLSSDGKLFFVQIKEAKRTGKKWFVSVFPVDRFK